MKWLRIGQHRIPGLKSVSMSGLNPDVGDWTFFEKSSERMSGPPSPSSAGADVGVGDPELLPLHKRPDSRGQ
jgi:hypothetical protein